MNLVHFNGMAFRGTEEKISRVLFLSSQAEIIPITMNDELCHRFFGRVTTTPPTGGRLYV